MEKYAEDLLIQIEKIIASTSRRDDFLRLIRLFNLNLPINRSSILNKSDTQIESDFSRWKAIAEAARRTLSLSDGGMYGNQ